MDINKLSIIGLVFPSKVPITSLLMQNAMLPYSTNAKSTEEEFYFDILTFLLDFTNRTVYSAILK